MSTPSSRRLRGRREESDRTEGIEFGGSQINSGAAPSKASEHSAPLETVVARLETHMGRTPRTFTPEALEMMRERESQYLDELGTEGIRQARRNRSDVVSAADIERADSLVRVSGQSRRATVLDTAGGILAGAGLGQLIDVLSQADPSATAVAISTGCLVPGIALVTLGLARRLHR